MEKDHFQNLKVEGGILFKNCFHGDSVIGRGHG